MRFNHNIGLIIYPCCLSLNTPSAHVLSFPAKTHTHTQVCFYPLLTSASSLVEKLKLSKGLRDVQIWRNLHAKSVVSRDITSDHHQRSDIRDNFFSAAENKLDIQGSLSRYMTLWP